MFVKMLFSLLMWIFTDRGDRSMFVTWLLKSKSICYQYHYYYLTVQNKGCMPSSIGTRLSVYGIIMSDLLSLVFNLVGTRSLWADTVLLADAVLFVHTIVRCVSFVLFEVSFEVKE